MPDMKEDVSCCVMTYNEEDNIADCLESVSWADEIIVVDSHSTDATREIAKKYTDNIVEHPFEGYVQQRAFSIERASNRWVLYVDADERVTSELRNEILAAMRDPGEICGFYMPRLAYYLGRFIKHGGWYPDRNLRLFRKDLARCAGRNPHDRVEVDGPTAVLKGDIIHYTYKDINDHLKRMKLFSRIAAEEMAKEGRRARVRDLVLRGPLKFLKMYIVKLGFLDGVAGLVIAWLGCISVFLKYARLWELSNVGESPEVTS